MTQVIVESHNSVIYKLHQNTACIRDLQFEKHFNSTDCTKVAQTNRHLGTSLIFLFYILAPYILWLMFGVMISRLESIITT